MLFSKPQGEKVKNKAQNYMANGISPANSDFAMGDFTQLPSSKEGQLCKIPCQALPPVPSVPSVFYQQSCPSKTVAAKCY
jgi:hypothetical protein